MTRCRVSMETAPGGASLIRIGGCTRCDNPRRWFCCHLASGAAPDRDRTVPSARCGDRACVNYAVGVCMVMAATALPLTEAVAA